MRDRRLQGVKAIVERQQRMSAECDNDRLILEGKNRRFRRFGTGRPIGDRRPPLPFGYGLLVDPVTLGQRPQALLTMLYRSTDRLCRCGAPVKNLGSSQKTENKAR